MADRLSPQEFANKYLKLCVYIFPPDDGGPDNSSLAPSGWQEVRVANYRLGASAYRETFWKDIESRLGKQVDVKVQTIDGALVDETLSVGKLSGHFRQPFAGKGSPEQVQIAIQTLYRYHKAHLSLQAFLQNDFIGLDCNGFAGNYYQRVIQGVLWNQQDNNKDPGPNAFIEGLIKMSGADGQVTKLDDMTPSKIYILAECDAKTGVIADPVAGVANTYGHVMLTQPGTLSKTADGNVTVGVSEATADGGRELRTDVAYAVSQPRKTPGGVVFRVERGSATDTLDVRIAALKMS